MEASMASTTAIRMLKRQTLSADQAELFRLVYDQIEVEQLEVRRPIDGPALATTIITAIQSLDQPTVPFLLIAVRMRRDDFVPKRLPHPQSTAQ
jgi:hypothetical protein